jgi:protein-arginine kinase activator protein McsA
VSIEELKEKLKELTSESDYESAHKAADKLLLEYINDAEVSEIFEDEIGKWYT